MTQWKQTVMVLAFSGLTACAMAGDGSVAKAPPAGEYQKVSELAALPELIPGMGQLYVQPKTLPAGPFLAYDRRDRLVSTVYMIPLADMQNRKNFENLETTGRKVVRTDLQYNAGHPGVAEPHYHVVLWHVPPAQAELK
jgi:hypothetical protein